MKRYATHPLAQLQARKADIMKELEGIAPTIARELLRLDEEIRIAELGVGSIFSIGYSQKDAVIRCLEMNGMWMTKPQITNALIEGGYRIKEPVLVGKIVGDVVKTQSRPGKALATEAGGDYVGLAHWVGVKDIKRLL